MKKESVPPPVRHFSAPIAVGWGPILRRGQGFRILVSALGLSILFFSLALGVFCQITEADDGEPTICYIVRPDPGRAAVDVRAIVRLDDRRQYLKDFGQLTSIRWFIGGEEVEVKSERVKDILFFSGLPHSGEAEAVYTLKLVEKAEPGYRKRLMGGPGYIMAREGLFLGKSQAEMRPVDVTWVLPPGWSLVLGSPGIQTFDRTQKGLWIAGKTSASFEETVEGRILRGAILEGVTRIDGNGLRRALTSVFRSGLERFGPIRRVIQRTMEPEGPKPDQKGLAETYGVAVFPDGTIGGGTALGFDLASEESLPTIIHEMLHWWTNHGAPAWFREGVHSYISIKLMAEIGLVTDGEFRKAMQGFLTEHALVVEREGALLTLDESSKAYDRGKGGGDMYGAMPLLAFKLDREIQAANPKADLGLVFADVCRRRPASIDIPALIKSRTGYDPEPLLRRYFYAPIADAGELLR